MVMLGKTGNAEPFIALSLCLPMLIYSASTLSPFEEIIWFPGLSGSSWLVL